MKRIAILAGLGLAAAAAPARAWEAATTHAGLTEQAAVGSHLHARLHALGFDRGLYESLTIPPEDAGALLAALKQFAPTGGFTPDARGRQFALGWLVAGAVLADGPFAVNHFYDALTGAAWDRPELDDAWDEFLDEMARWQGKDALPDGGVAAPDWVVAKDNPLGLAGFLDQYERAVTGASPGERSRAMAGALVAAGAILHAVEDMGSPSHVRGDLLAHTDPLGEARGDLGSRFEHIAALAYGRLGVPAPARVVTRTTLRGFFTAVAKGGHRASEPGLADEVATHWFSEHTLPAPTRIGQGGRTVAPALARPLPAPPARLNLMAASQPQGTTLDDAAGVCLARYRVERGVLSFWLDDDCMLAEVDAILPEVSSYAAGTLDFLFRGELTLALGGGRATVKAKGPLGAGKLTVLAEDGKGARTAITTADVRGAVDGAKLGDALVPDGAVRAIAIFRGNDANGEPIVAVGALDLK